MYKILILSILIEPISEVKMLAKFYCFIVSEDVYLFEGNSLQYCATKNSNQKSSYTGFKLDWLASTMYIGLASHDSVTQWLIFKVSFWTALITIKVENILFHTFVICFCPRSYSHQGKVSKKFKLMIIFM